MARRFVIQEAPAHKTEIGKLHPGAFFVLVGGDHVHLYLPTSDESEMILTYSFEDREFKTYKRDTQVHPLTTKANFYKQPA